MRLLCSSRSSSAELGESSGGASKLLLYSRSSTSELSGPKLARRTSRLSYKLSTLTLVQPSTEVRARSLLAATLTSSRELKEPTSGGSLISWLLNTLSTLSFFSLPTAAGNALIPLRYRMSSSSSVHSPIASVSAVSLLSLASSIVSPLSMLTIISGNVERRLEETLSVATVAGSTTSGRSVSAWRRWSCKSTMKAATMPTLGRVERYKC